jgi:hypothetical protein
MSDMAEQEKCALWYDSCIGGVDYDLEDSETDAADYAVALENSDTPADILGIQFPDGRTVAANQWAALVEARERATQRWRERMANPPAPTPTRTVHDPFRGEQVEVETGEPDWIGQ